MTRTLSIEREKRITLKHKFKQEQEKVNRIIQDAHHQVKVAEQKVHEITITLERGKISIPTLVVFYVTCNVMRVVPYAP